MGGPTSISPRSPGVRKRTAAAAAAVRTVHKVVQAVQAVPAVPVAAEVESSSGAAAPPAAPAAVPTSTPHSGPPAHVPTDGTGGVGDVTMMEAQATDGKAGVGGVPTTMEAQASVAAADGGRTNAEDTLGDAHAQHGGVRGLLQQERERLLLEQAAGSFDLSAVNLSVGCAADPLSADPLSVDPLSGCLADQTNMGGGVAGAAGVAGWAVYEETSVAMGSGVAGDAGVAGWSETVYEESGHASEGEERWAEAVMSANWIHSFDEHTAVS